MQKGVKMWQNSATFWRSNNFPGVSTFSPASEGPQNGGKLTRMDILEFRCINGPGLIWRNLVDWSLDGRTLNQWGFMAEVDNKNYPSLFGLYQICFWWNTSGYRLQIKEVLQMALLRELRDCVVLQYLCLDFCKGGSLHI